MVGKSSQQWMNWNAITSCVAYAASSVVLNLINKAVFSREDFRFPWFTLAFQNLISSLIAVVVTSLGWASSSGFSHELSYQLLIPISFFVVFIFSNAMALRYMSLPLLTVFKSLAPMGVTLVERFLFLDVVTKEVYLSMILVVVSTAITFVYDVEYSLWGYSWALLNVVANIGYLASLRYCVSDSFGHFDKTLHSNILSLFLILPISVMSGDVPNALKGLQTTSLAFRVTFASSGVFTMMLSASAFWCLSTTDGSTLSFVGGLNKIPIVILGYLFFDTIITSKGWFGICLGMVAGLIFVKHKSNCKKAPMERTSSAGAV